MHRRAKVVLIGLVLVFLILATGCGGNGAGGGISQPQNPQFTSTPPANASEGVTYSYSPVITGDSGAGILALTEAPVGATLSGAGVTWTPTQEQSRRANNFTLKVTAQAGGTATQSWSVTPSGTVRVNRVDTVWGETGSNNVPFDWTAVAAPPAALVPQTDGTVKTVAGAGGADGRLSIPNVPGGYYWLKTSPMELYWTNSSDVDLGADYNMPMGLVQFGSGMATTTFNFNVTGYEPGAGRFLQITLDPWFSFGSSFFGGGNSENFTLNYPIGSNIDWTKVKTGSALEYKTVQLGAISGSVIGPAALLTNLSLTNGGINNIDVPLTASPQKSIALSVKGSAWQPLFAKVGPSAATPFSTPFALAVDQALPTASTRLAFLGRNIILLAPNSTSMSGSLVNFASFVAMPVRLSCSGATAFIPPVAPPSLTSDVDMGTIEYGDPLPETWSRYFQICQTATVDVDMPAPDGSSTLKMMVTNGATMPLPTGPVNPVVGPVENPTINDQSLFTAATISGANVTLKWQKPALGNPTAYVVRVITGQRGSSGTVIYGGLPVLATAQNSVTVPPGLLEAGRTYVFMITAIVDGRAKVETAPRRTGVPMANADIVSAPITIAAQ